MITGILPVNKPAGITSFGVVARLRKVLGVQKIGHSGTLDPFATGVLVLLLGRTYTKMANTFTDQDKEYVANVRLGISTDTYDKEGVFKPISEKAPTLDEIKNALEHFQGEILQVPPMFSAKKVGGKKLYELARKGVVIERKAVTVRLQTTLVSYAYPFVKLQVSCSKGTYIRSLAHDLGNMLGTGAYLDELVRTRNGQFDLNSCINLENVHTDTVGNFLIQNHESH